jgi:hypothetical protein
VLEEPQSAFEYFRGSYPRGAAIDDNKALLKEKYTLAKTLGERVNQVGG